MRIDIVTIFPDMFGGVFNASLIGKAMEKGLVEIHIHDLRRWTTDSHKTTDDYPYGGGVGMVMKIEPLHRAVTELRPQNRDAEVILMTPQGTPLSHAIATELAPRNGMIILCGRYEGFDERVRTLLADREISIGDYVLTGGEIPAMVLADSVTRLIPGVVGDATSTITDSHAEPLLEHPHYTRPPEFEGEGVPDILLSGHHANIEKWRRDQQIIRTAQRRPDLLEKANLTEQERRLAEKNRRKTGE